MLEANIQSASLIPWLLCSGSCWARSSGRKGRGKNKPCVLDNPEVEQASWTRELLDALPQAAVLRSQTRLLQNEWSVPVMHVQQLSSAGGVAHCTQECLPGALRSIGYTASPVGVVVTSVPPELRGYPRAKISCTLVVCEDDGTQSEIQVDRILLQLGFGALVRRVYDGEKVELDVKMVAMTMKFGQQFGWSEMQYPATICLDQLSKYVHEAAVAEIVSRHDGTARFLLHASQVEKLLRASGTAGVFYKINEEHPLKNLELLWLPEMTPLDQALSYILGVVTYGLCCKGKSQYPRLAVRFQTEEQVSSFARDRNLPDVSQLQRWRLAGVPLFVGVHGLQLFLQSSGWVVHSIIYHDDKAAVFLATEMGEVGAKYFSHKGRQYQLRFKACNSRAEKAHAAHSRTQQEARKAAAKAAAAPPAPPDHQSGSASSSAPSAQPPLFINERLARQQQFLEQLPVTPRNAKRTSQERTGETPELQRPRQQQQSQQQQHSVPLSQPQPPVQQQAQESAPQS